MQKRNTFFTLIELMTVVVLVALLASIALGITNLAVRKSDDTKMTALIESLRNANESYKQRYGFYCPPTTQKYESEYNSLPFNVNFLGEVYEQVRNISSSQASQTEILDIWGNPIRYRYPGKFNTSTFDIYSVGSDGVVGNGSKSSWNIAGTGDDISNFKNNK